MAHTQAPEAEFFVAFASAARTATPTAVDIDMSRHSGVILLVDVTADPASASVVFNFDGYDPIADASWTLLDSAAVASVSHNVYDIWPGATAAANVAANKYVPGTLRITPVHADADSITYSVQGWRLP